MLGVATCNYQYRIYTKVEDLFELLGHSPIKQSDWSLIISRGRILVETQME